MTLTGRIAAAPISWGVIEVAGWGHQMAPERVLAEMREAGLAATELGPAGFLPRAPADKAALLATFGLAPVGAFVPEVLHDASRDVLAAVEPALAALAAVGATTLVLAADTGAGGYDGRVQLDDASWDVLVRNLDRLADAAGARGLRATLHPHAGTVVEGPGDVERVLAGSRIPLCLDTGHLLIGGSDPGELASAAAHRIGHVHLKDVDAALAADLRDGRLSYRQAVREGLYRPLGQGDVDVAGIVAALESSGYAGWYVLEQDAVVEHEPQPGEGPAADVRASLAFLRGSLVR